ncbi:MAG TPA: asparagine synthase (glutamine-hydrolyzing) [Solirubrobacteraceae bacterium]|nr:asparagine synthase (glutamine-hydrolyzing) [Solirubrobacteraceae bacterium]
MCGIAGALRHDGAPVSEESLWRAARSIAHRGPDDEGIHVDGPVGLAHRRLSIIDLSAAGRQPMGNEDGTLWLTYNGEIYNHRELRRLLEARGHRFASHTDSEVLVHGYEEWGTELLERLNGIFAFAIWDARERELLLARDRFGAKPLYVSRNADRLLFGSEVKALLALSQQPARLSLEALCEYMTFQNTLGEQTLFAGVTTVAPGTWLRVRADGTARRGVYYDPLPAPQPAPHPDEIAEALRAALQRAVDRQLMADVPVGAYLSGGMDSASLVVLAGRRIPHIHTFTAGFDVADASPLEVAIDERPDAEIVARDVGTEHYGAVLHAGDLARVMPDLVWHLEDLRAGTCYQNYCVARLASKFVKVVMAGTGGDELFAGYPWRYARLAGARDRRGFLDAYYEYWCRLISDELRPRAFTDDAWAVMSAVDPRASFERVTAHLDPELDPVEQALYFEQRTFLHGLLVVEDRMSMAHGLEARVPFLDNELVELALRIPARVRAGSGEGKALLRHAARAFLPDALVRKRKQGFSPPDGTWYRGRNLSYVREILLDPGSLRRGLFRPEFVDRVIRDHADGKADNRLMIWSLLSLEWWHRMFVDDAGARVARARAGDAHGAAA